MDEKLKKLSTEVKDAFVARLATQEFKDFMAVTKSAADSGEFEVIISTADMDRQGEIVDQNGWQLDRYLANPVVLWAHDYSSLPIGVCESLTKDANGNLVAKGKFAPAEANPFAQQVRKLYDAKMVRATSVGFIPLDFDGANKITKAELLEFSFVPVPANPFALSLRQVKELGLDTTSMITKGLVFNVKAEDEVTPPAENPAPETQPETPAAPAAEKAGGEDGDEGDSVDQLTEALATEHGRHADEVNKCIMKFMNADAGDTDAEKAARKAKADAIAKTFTKGNRSTLETLSEQLKSASAAIDALLKTEEASGNGGEVTPPAAAETPAAEGDSANSKVEASEAEAEGKGVDDLNEFLLGRELLKEVATTVGGALERYNKQFKKKLPARK